MCIYITMFCNTIPTNNAGTPIPRSCWLPCRDIKGRHYTPRAKSRLAREYYHKVRSLDGGQLRLDSCRHLKNSQIQVNTISVSSTVQVVGRKSKGEQQQKCNKTTSTICSGPQSLFLWNRIKWWELLEGGLRIFLIVKTIRGRLLN